MSLGESEKWKFLEIVDLEKSAAMFRVLGFLALLL